jgi:hypothetical protein
MSEQQLNKAIAIGTVEMIRKEIAEKKYDALLKLYNQEKEQYELTIAYLNKMLAMEQLHTKTLTEIAIVKEKKQKVIEENAELLRKLQQSP